MPLDREIVDLFDSAVEKHMQAETERLDGVSDAMYTLIKYMQAPRKKVLVRDERGRATHAIETVIEDAE